MVYIVQQLVFWYLMLKQLNGKNESFFVSFFFNYVLLLIEKFLEMKDEIFQVVIDSYVKNVVSVWVEKVKQEILEENIGVFYIIQLLDKFLFLMCIRGIFFVLFQCLIGQLVDINFEIRIYIWKFVLGFYMIWVFLLFFLNGEYEFSRNF